MIRRSKVTRAIWRYQQKENIASKAVIVLHTVNMAKNKTRSSCATITKKQHLQACQCALFIKKNLNNVK